MSFHVIFGMCGFVHKQPVRSSAEIQKETHTKKKMEREKKK